MTAGCPINLTRFCGVGDPRDFMRRPFLRDGSVHATNGQVLIRVPCWPGSEAAYKQLEPQHLEMLAPMFEEMKVRTDWRPLSGLTPPEQCRRCKGAGTLRGTTCESCEGEGEFEHHDYTYECKACDGDGLHEDQFGEDSIPCNNRGCKRGLMSARHPVGENCVDAVYLAWIAELPSVSISPGRDGQKLFFKFDGGDGILMPRR